MSSAAFLFTLWDKMPDMLIWGRRKKGGEKDIDYFFMHEMRGREILLRRILQISWLKLISKAFSFEAGDTFR